MKCPLCRERMDACRRPDRGTFGGFEPACVQVACNTCGFGGEILKPFTATIYRIVSVDGDGWSVIDLPAIERHARVAGWTVIGDRKGHPQYREMFGPTFEDENGTTVVRYETWPAQERLSS